LEKKAVGKTVPQIIFRFPMKKNTKVKKSTRRKAVKKSVKKAKK